VLPIKRVSWSGLGMIDPRLMTDVICAPSKQTGLSILNTHDPSRFIKIYDEYLCLNFNTKSKWKSTTVMKTVWLLYNEGGVGISIPARFEIASNVSDAMLSWNGHLTLESPDAAYQSLASCANRKLKRYDSFIIFYNFVNCRAFTVLCIFCHFSDYNWW